MSVYMNVCMYVAHVRRSQLAASGPLPKRTLKAGIIEFGAQGTGFLRRSFAWKWARGLGS